MNQGIYIEGGGDIHIHEHTEALSPSFFKPKLMTSAVSDLTKFDFDSSRFSGGNGQKLYYVGKYARKSGYVAPSFGLKYESVKKKVNLLKVMKIQHDLAKPMIGRCSS